jgi:mRNA interferase MazF
MSPKKFEIWIANLNPAHGTEPGEIRPVVVMQTNLLNPVHSSVIICPITTKVTAKATLLRVHLSKKSSGLSKDSDILVDQIRAIDNQRLTKKVGKLNPSQREKLLRNLQILILE